jgi:hypothetical protein
VLDALTGQHDARHCDELQLVLGDVHLRQDAVEVAAQSNRTKVERLYQRRMRGDLPHGHVNGDGLDLVFLANLALLAQERATVISDAEMQKYLGITRVYHPIHDDSAVLDVLGSGVVEIVLALRLAQRSLIKVRGEIRVKDLSISHAGGFTESSSR